MLSPLEEQLATAHGLSIAAQTVSARLLALVADNGLRAQLHELGRDSSELRARCVELAARYDEETATELLHSVNRAKDRAADLANAWFKAGTGPLEGWTFLAMSEAAEAVAWRGVHELASSAGDDDLCTLGTWGLAVQERHLLIALEGPVRLAATI